MIKVGVSVDQVVLGSRIDYGAKRRGVWRGDRAGKRISGGNSLEGRYRYGPRGRRSPAHRPAKGGIDRRTGENKPRAPEGGEGPHRSPHGRYRLRGGPRLHHSPLGRA